MLERDGDVCFYFPVSKTFRAFIIVIFTAAKHIEFLITLE